MKKSVHNLFRIPVHKMLDFPNYLHISLVKLLHTKSYSTNNRSAILEKYEENCLVFSTSFFNSDNAILFNSCLSDNIVFKFFLPFILSDHCDKSDHKNNDRNC